MSFVRNARFLATRGSRMLQSRGYADEMKLTFAAANQTFYANAEVQQIDVPSFSGSFGILAKHVPTLAVLKPGVVQVVEKDGKRTSYFVSSGTITVNEDSSVQVLAEEAHELSALDGNACKELVNQYRQKLNSASSDVDKAEATIALECAEELAKAAH